MNVQNDTKNYNRFSDTPQGGLNGIESNTYLTDARLIDESSSNNSQNVDSGKSKDSFSGSENDNRNKSGNENSGEERVRSENVEKSGSRSDGKVIKGTEDYLEHIYGKNGGEDYSSLLKKYRETFINIDVKIIV